MTPAQRTANNALLKRLGVVAVAMFGFGFLLVPFYEKICEVTGIRNIRDAAGSRLSRIARVPLKSA